MIALWPLDTQISYNTIVLVSILLAILYFATVAFFVRIEAKRNHVTALDTEKVSAIEVFKKGGVVFLLPIGVLVGLLGFMEARLNWPVRLLTMGCAAALLCPAAWWVHGAGLLILCVIFVLNRRASHRLTEETLGAQAQGLQPLMATSLATSNAETD